LRGSVGELHTSATPARSEVPTKADVAPAGRCRIDSTAQFVDFSY